MNSPVTPAPGASPPDEMRRHWPAVLACFAVAVYAWGFGFYGQSVYVAELQRARGWPAAAVAGAGTLFYLAGAVLLPRVDAALGRSGPRVVLAGGAALLGLGASGFANAAEPWQLYAAALPMALGWAGCSAVAIAAALAPLFDRRRGLAVSLALNGASAAGFTVAPALALLADRHGLGPVVPAAALALLVVLLPLVAMGFPRRGGDRAGVKAGRAGAGPAAPGSIPRGGFAAGRGVLRAARFWTAAAPYALALTAQVGLVLHLVAFLSPALGAAGAAAALSIVGAAAMAGRLALGLAADRLDPRRASAASYALQAAALGLMLGVPEPWALHAGCALFGLSVGNVITLPALIVQREFPAAAFGAVLGLATAVAQLAFAWGPALLGAVRDAAGGYGPALGLCAAMQLSAAALVLAGRPRR